MAGLRGKLSRYLFFSCQHRTMPEGPEIRRAAEQVAAAVAGREVRQLYFAFDHLKRYESLLAESAIRAVETYGKAMLIRFSCGLSIYSHNQLYGRWYICKAGGRPRTRRQLRLAIDNGECSALLYSASDIAVLRDDEIAVHPFIGKLGPDVLSPQTSEAMIIERLRDKRFRNRQLGGLLTAQSFVAGLGNYLRSEILFVSGLSPACQPKQLDERQLEQLATAILVLPRQSYETDGITNEPHNARRLIQQGASFEEARFWVFRRESRPCYRCGTPIVRVRRGGQPVYLCPHCQRNC